MSISLQSIYLAGDNDVGGEAFDVYEPGKVAQFEKFFDKESGVNRVKFVDLIHVSGTFFTILLLFCNVNSFACKQG